MVNVRLEETIHVNFVRPLVAAKLYLARLGLLVHKLLVMLFNESLMGRDIRFPAIIVEILPAHSVSNIGGTGAAGTTCGEWLDSHFNVRRDFYSLIRRSGSLRIWGPLLISCTAVVSDEVVGIRSSILCVVAQKKRVSRLFH